MNKIKRFLPVLLTIILALILTVPLAHETKAEQLNVSDATLYTSNLQNYSDELNLCLVANTTLVIDSDKTIRSISGDYNLAIEGKNGSVLTVTNPSSTAINVGNLSVSKNAVVKVNAPKSNGIVSSLGVGISDGSNVTVTAKGTAIQSRTSLTVQKNATLTAEAGNYALVCSEGTISMTGSTVTVNVTSVDGSDAVSAEKSVVIDSTKLNIVCSAMNCIYANTGNISIINGSNVKSKGIDNTEIDHNGIYAEEGNILIKDSTVDSRTKGSTCVYAYEGTVTVENSTVITYSGKFGIRGGGNIDITGGKVEGRATRSVVWSYNNLTVTGTEFNIATVYGFLYGSIGASEDLTLSNVKGKIYCTNDICVSHIVQSDYGNVNITGASSGLTVDATGGYGGIWAGEGNMTIGGNITVIAPVYPALQVDEGSLTLSGNIKIDSKKDFAVEAQKKDINITGGSVTVTSNSSCLVSGEGKITLAGTVTLESKGTEPVISAEAVSVTGGKLTAKAAAGTAILATDGDITVASGAEIDITAGGDEEAGAVYSPDGAITIAGKATVTTSSYNGIQTGDGGIAITGTVKADAGRTPVFTDGDLRISGATVEANGNYYGIVSNSHVNINGSTVTAKGNQGIFSGKNMFIQNSTVTATGSGSNGISLNGNFECNHSTITVSGGTTGLYVSGGVLFSDAQATITGSTKAVSVKDYFNMNVPTTIETPSGGFYAGKTILDTSGNIAKKVVIKTQRITGSVKINGTATYAGDQITFSVSGLPSSTYNYYWQYKKSGGNWIEISGAPKYQNTAAGSVGTTYRVRVTVDGYYGELFSDERTVQALPAITGTMIYNGTFCVGEKVTGYPSSGSNVSSVASTKFNYQWQYSANGSSGWTNISGATGRIYTIPVSVYGKYIREVITVDGYTGSLIGSPSLVTKKTNTGTLVAPELTPSSADSYTKVNVTNAKAAQEYLLSYSPDTPSSWSSASSPSSDGTLQLSCSANARIYVHTRLKETDTLYAGETSTYASAYMGSSTNVVGFEFAQREITIKAGEPYLLELVPIPSTATWDSTYTVTWGISAGSNTGSGTMNLYTISGNKKPVVPKGTPTHIKSAYIRISDPGRYYTVSVEKQVGYNDIIRTTCTIHVTDADGNFPFEYVSFPSNVYVIQGSTYTATYTPYPVPSVTPGKMTFTKHEGPTGDLTLVDNEDGTFTITAPEGAGAGKYIYYANIDGVEGTSYVTVTVLSNSVTATFVPGSGSGSSFTRTVKVWEELVLPEQPSGFKAPAGCHFSGWGIGQAGEGVFLGENMTITAQWAKHTIETVNAVAATCTTDGHKVYYRCTGCGKIFSDKNGQNEVASADTFRIAATGHKAGSTVKENVVAATCHGAGGYDNVVRCTVCGEKISSTHVTVPALTHVKGKAVRENEIASTCTEAGGYDTVIYCTLCGDELERTHTAYPLASHKLKAVAEKAATCEIEGRKAYYVCEECGKRFSDSSGKNEITDISNLTIPATGHTFGEWTVTVKPTETETGVRTHVCSVCGAEESESVPCLTALAITVKAGAHGTAKTSVTGALEGDAVTVTATPDEGYELDKVTMTPEGGKASDITGAMSFTMPASSVTVEVTFRKVAATEAPATDVPATDVTGTGSPATDVTGTEAPATDASGTGAPATVAPGTEEANATGQSGTDDNSGSKGPGPLLWILIGVGALLLIGAIILILLMKKRKEKKED